MRWIGVKKSLFLFLGEGEDRATFRETEVKEYCETEIIKKKDIVDINL